MKRVKLLLALSVLSGGLVVHAENPAAQQQQVQVLADISREQAIALVEQLGFLIEDAKITGIESVAEPLASWKVSFTSPHATPDKFYSGEVQLQKSDGTLNAVKIKQKSGGRTAEQIFDMNEQKVSWEEAREIVDAFMAEHPWFAELSLLYRPYPLTLNDTRFEDHSLHFVLYDSSINGIRYSLDNRWAFRADVDRRTGEIANYSVDWVQPPVANSVEVLPLEKIANRIFDDVSPVLTYGYSEQTGEAPPLVWSLNVRYRALDAVTGEWEGDSPTEDEQRYKPIGSPPEKPYLTKLDITEEEYRNAPWPSFDEETARLNAHYYLQQKVPDSMDQLGETYVSLSFWTQPKIYSFTFERRINGVSLANSENINLQVDAITGELIYFSSTLSDYEYPSMATPVIQAERAKRLLLSLYDIELQYEDWGNDQLKLVYRIKTKPDTPLFFTGDPPYLDALMPRHWRDFLSQRIEEPMPAASEWLADIISAPERINYPVAIALNGEFIPLDPEPLIVYHNTLVPIRALVEALGGTVHWNNGNRTVIATLGDKQVELPVSPPETGNEDSAKIIPAAQLINDSTYVSVRLITEMLGADLDWYGSSRIVNIKTDGSSSEKITEQKLVEKELRQIRLQAQLGWEEKHWQ